mmetsp:Transcript_63315/g.152858  ORF Transcript_63315/g.152858 Transcript_63315/m.152858 type:complete len:324 (+) Transcript_63315:780-1751(+)
MGHGRAGRCPAADAGVRRRRHGQELRYRLDSAGRDLKAGRAAHRPNHRAGHGLVRGGGRRRPDPVGGRGAREGAQGGGRGEEEGGCGEGEGGRSGRGGHRAGAEGAEGGGGEECRCCAGDCARARARARAAQPPPEPGRDHHRRPPAVGPRRRAAPRRGLPLRRQNLLRLLHARSRGAGPRDQVAGEQGRPAPAGAWQPRPRLLERVERSREEGRVGRQRPLRNGARPEESLPARRHSSLRRSPALQWASRRLPAHIGPPQGARRSDLIRSGHHRPARSLLECSDRSAPCAGGPAQAELLLEVRWEQRRPVALRHGPARHDAW